jgi:hypothetical protein
MSKDETLRRIRLGDLQRLLRLRYGHELPDDDAGREDLYELLLPISLGDGHSRKMAKAIELLAPWMTADERLQLIDNINRTPDNLRKITAPALGKKLNLKNREREQLGIRTIAPVDMTAKQLQEQRRAKKRARDERRRRAAKKQPREVYLATHSLSRDKPWEEKGISRRTWERRRNKNRDARQRQIKLTNAKRSLASRRKLRVSEKGRGLPRKVVRKVGRGVVHPCGTT